MVGLAAHEPRRANAGRRQTVRIAEQGRALRFDAQLAVTGYVQYQLVWLVRHDEAHSTRVVTSLVLEVPVFFFFCVHECENLTPALVYCNA